MKGNGQRRCFVQCMNRLFCVQTRRRWRRIWHGLVLLAVASTRAAVYDFSVGDAGNRQVRLNIPDDLPVVRGILVWGNGFPGDVRAKATDPEMVAFAESMGFAVMGTSMWNYFALGYTPSEYSGWQYALDQLAAMSRHPELVRAPWLPFGMSNGGQMSYGLNALAPEKSIAMAINKAPFINIALPGYAALHTPGLIIAGEFDQPAYVSGVHDIYFNNRPRGALWAWAEEEMTAHTTGDSYELILPFMADLYAMRYPAGASPGFAAVNLLPVDELNGWLTDPDSYKNGLADIAPYADYPKDKSIAGWLPTRRLAYIFRAYASYHKATRTVMISPGTGPVDWDTTITYAIGEPVAPWTAVDFFEGDVFLKRVTRAEGTALSVVTTASAPGYSVFHSLVTLADGTQRTTMPRRVFVRTGTPQPPTVRLVVDATTVATGGTITLSANVTGYPAPALQWRKEGVDLPGVTGAFLTLADAQAADAACYSVVARNDLGTVTSAPVAVSVASALAGSYAGTTSEGAPWAMLVRADGTAVFLAALAGNSQAIVARNFAVAADGTFRFNGTATSAGGGVSPLAARYSTGAVEGQIAAGRVSGLVMESNRAFSGALIATTATSATGGFFQAQSGGAASCEAYALEAGDGALTLVEVHAGGVSGFRGQENERNEFTVANASGTLSGRCDDAGGFSGALAQAGAAPVALSPAVAGGRLANLSTRGLAGGGAATLIVGFVVEGASAKEILLRAVGPALGAFGVSGALGNPQLQLYRDAAVIGENAGWSAGGAGPLIAAAATRAGAFALPNGSADAALLVTLAPGSYTAHATAASGAPGTVLVEAYDTEAALAGRPRLVNLSARGEFGRATGALIAGFVISGELPKRVLLRAAGPALAALGVSGVLADPRLQLFRGATLLRENDDWSVSANAAEVANAAGAVRAFAFAAGSKDAALLLSLPPGAYSAQVRGTGDTTGIALIEVYEIP